MFKVELEKDFEFQKIERECKELWRKAKIFEYDPDATTPTFSVDTPPPYVSAAHLHVGHAMSYSQAEFVVRYKRMQGFNIFYPMGFDDNGLPTERFVEQNYNINKKEISRRDFRKLCLDETTKGAKAYEELWRALGLSVDWKMRYSTIDERCQYASQLSFIDLYSKGEIYRSDDPVLWDTHFETALAQADIETITRKSKIHDIQFQAQDGRPLVISTTRPELIPACVALYCNPEDERYRHLLNTHAEVPLFGYMVPIKSSSEVKTDFGTGLMMVCTFGDGEDVAKWREDRLDTRICVMPDGRLSKLAGKYQGLEVEQARAEILRDLKEAGLLLGTSKITQVLSVAERSETPVEFAMVPQWFIRVLDKKERLLERSAELNWSPSFMKVRLDQWIDGLKYDWNISRQRFYGVPFPVWYCASCHEVVLAAKEDLPVDPLESAPPVDSCPKCGNTDFKGESDVMDTWMTSSMTPFINSKWGHGALHQKNLEPMSVRVQAFEIVRSWLFYSLVKSDIHCDSIPWKDVMISGWGLNEQGKKISKRDLEKYTDSNGFNRYAPESVIASYGADALRYWAAGSHLGNDLRYHEKGVKAGLKLVIKLWNASRLCALQMEGFDPAARRTPFAERSQVDQWLLIEVNKLVKRVTQGFERYDYAIGRDALDSFFWQTFCDNYLEIVKDRFWRPELHSDTSRISAQATMYECLRALLSLFAPYVPFISEALYVRIYSQYEPYVSIHISPWPKVDEQLLECHESDETKLLLALLRSVRILRTKMQIPQGRKVGELVLDVANASKGIQQMLQSMRPSLMAIARCESVKFGEANEGCGVGNVRVGIVPQEQR